MHHGCKADIILLEAILCNVHSSFSLTIDLADVRQTEFVFDVLETTEGARVVDSQDVADSLCPARSLVSTLIEVLTG